MRTEFQKNLKAIFDWSRLPKIDDPEEWWTEFSRLLTDLMMVAADVLRGSEGIEVTLCPRDGGKGHLFAINDTKTITFDRSEDGVHVRSPLADISEDWSRPHVRLKVAEDKLLDFLKAALKVLP
jgi:hypothetical protein